MERRLCLAGLGLLAVGLGGCLSNKSNSTGDLNGAVPPIEVDAGDASASPPPSVILGADSVIDFGMIACGAPAPAAQTFTVTNSGSTTVHYGLSLSPTTAFQIVGATAGDVAPGSNATASIAVSMEPTSATAGAVDQATLTITTDDPNHPSTSVALKRTAQGATLSLSPTTVAFLDTPVTATSQPLALTLTNTGNLAASFAIGSPSDPQFALTWTGPSPVSLAPGASVPGLSATFSPTAAATAAATSPLTLGTPVCGASISSIAFSGTGTKGIVAVTPGTLPFGSVSCGSKTAAQTVTIKNSGNGTFNFKAALLLGSSSPFTVSPASGPVAAGATATVTVTPLAIPAVASVASNAFGDTLRITSDAVGDADHDVTLTETAQGAVLALNTTTIGFNDVTLQQTSSSPFTIQNTGNVPVTLTLAGSGAPFGVSPATATTLTVGGSPLAGSATYKPTALGAASGSITVTAATGTVLCSAPIGPIHLTGTGVNGVLSISKNTLDFASVPCGQATSAQSFTINNTGTAPFTWKAALGKTPSPYTVSPASGTQTPGAPATTVTVTPTAIPFPSALTANLYGDTLTVTPTGISGGVAQTIALQETAEGAIVTATPSPVPSFGNQQEGQATSAATLTITNTGTMPVTITSSLTGANPAAFLLVAPGATALAANGGHYSPGPEFKPLTGGALAAQVALAQGAGDVLCQALPGPIALSGTGANGALTVGNGSVTFPAQTCGATAGTQSVQLTNNGTAALTFNAAILGGTGFQVSPATGTLAANGGTAPLTVTSPTFSTATGNVNTVTDTLRVTTSAYGDTNHDIPLSSTPSGAILGWETGAFAFGTVQATSNASKSKGLPFSLGNSGNLAATVSFATQSGDQYTFAPQNTSLGASNTLNGTATFTPTASGLQQDTMLVSVAGGTPLCAPLPAGLGLTGTGAQGTFSTGATGFGFALTCNAPVATQSFSIDDFKGGEPYDFTVSIGSGWTVNPTSGTVSAGGSTPITITPPAEGDVKVGTTSDVQVTVTTDIPGDGAHSYAVDGTVTGAELVFAASTVAFGDSVATGTTTTYLNNDGNVAEPVSYVVTADPSNYNTDPSLLLVTWGGTANIGQTPITYAFNASVSLPCFITMTYTVTFPNTTTEGVCSSTSQTVTVTPSNGC